jgi:hypothetical protein
MGRCLSSRSTSTNLRTMPRIEIIPKDLVSDDGSPTIDVCKGCAVAFTDGEQVNLLDELRRIPTHLVNFFEGFVGSTNVDHPPYNECDYDCEVCGKRLTDQNA